MDNMDNTNANKNTDNNEQITSTGATAHAADTAAAALPQTKVKRVLKEIREWVFTILVAVAVALVIKGLVFDIVRVDGHSMDTTLSHNDRLIVTKLGYKPKAGDIIILDSTYKKREQYYDELAHQRGKDTLSGVDKFFETFNLDAALQKRYYVKRVIALPGQTVDIHNGKVFIDGQELHEDYIQGRTFIKSGTADTFPLTVDEGMVFVMGDNREHSQDSRDPNLGLVPYKAILGKAQLRVWPFSSISAVK